MSPTIKNGDHETRKDEETAPLVAGLQGWLHDDQVPRSLVGVVVVAPGKRLQDDDGQNGGIEYQSANPCELKAVVAITPKTSEHDRCAHSGQQAGHHSVEVDDDVVGHAVGAPVGLRPNWVTTPDALRFKAEMATVADFPTCTDATSRLRDLRHDLLLTTDEFDQRFRSRLRRRSMHPAMRVAMGRA